MKKLNRKGFTLVELLAVIIILAIVIGITIPAVLNTINDSKNNALGVKVEAAQTWLEEQITIYNTDVNLIDQELKNIITDLATGNNYDDVAPDYFGKLGFSNKDITTLDLTVNSSGEVCVTVSVINTNGQYYSTKYWESDGTAGTGAEGKKAEPKNKSSHCPAS